MESDRQLPPSAKLKLDLMFEGVRYSEALGAAAAHAFPNFYPYRFGKGEPNPTGRDKVTIPYLMTLEDETMLRVKGNPDSAWQVTGSLADGYHLVNDDGRDLPIGFEPLPGWMSATCSDGTPMAQAGVSLHGDMAVINVAPGCEYFLAKDEDGNSKKCSFCAYGAPNERVAHFNQAIGTAAIPETTLARMQEVLTAAIQEGGIRHIYLVGGSMTDPAEEGERFLQLARAVQTVVQRRIPVALGSGAIPANQLQTFHDEQLVDFVCFNLEVWPEELFEQICPGKQDFVGFDNWLMSLEQAVALWGEGNVYSAMVAGIELEPEFGYDWEQAADMAVQGAIDLCDRGVLPIYSLYWPTGGRDHPDYFSRLRNYFERLNLGYQDIRERTGLHVADGFMCHRCAYMQLECDLDRG